MSDWQNRIVGYGEEEPEQLLANPRNHRIHPRRQQDALKGSLDTLGYIQTVIVNKTTQHIVDGHLRVVMAMREGQKSIPVTYVELTPEEEAQALLSLDPIAAMAANDRDKVDELLRMVNTDNADVMKHLADFAAENKLDWGQPEQVDSEPQLDRAAELQKLWGTSSGQLWKLGEHRLLVGDCTVRENVERLMGGERADMLLNDPPYGMRLDADFSGMENRLDFAREKGVKNGNKYDDVIGDHSDYDASPIIALFIDVKEQFWWGANYYSATLPDTMHTGAWIVWDKRLDESADKMYGSCFELLWSMKKHKQDILRHKWAGIFGTEHEAQRGRVHPNQKPVVLYEDLLNRYSKDGSIIVDCYAGSGTTIIAAQNLGRRCYAMEISPAYCAVILQRFADATGIQPELVN